MVENMQETRLLSSIEEMNPFNSDLVNEGSNPSPVYNERHCGWCGNVLEEDNDHPLCKECKVAYDEGEVI
jgi:hypothetical protein